MGSSRHGDSRGLGSGPRIAPSLAFLFAASAPLGADQLIVPRYSSAASGPLVIGLLALGVLIGLLAYTLFLAISTREPMFIYFSVIMVLLTVLQTFATYDRFLFRLTYNRVTLITHLLFITFLLFFEDFFSLAERRPRLSAFNRISIHVIAGYTLFFLAAKTIFPSAASFHGIIDFIRELFVFYTNVLFVYTIVAARAWMRVESILLLIAFIPPALMTTINAMGIFPFMRRYGGLVEWLMRYNQPIGLSLQAILFSLAMGNRYNRIKLERQESRREAERLQRLDAEKTEFFMNLSHETRTPLTIILGMVRQLRHGRFGDSVSGNDRILAAIERNGQRLLRKVTMMLRLGRPTTSLVREELPIDGCLRSMVDEFAAVAAQRSIAIRYEPGTGTAALALRIAGEDFETLVMNLLSNALRFTPAGGAISVSAKLGSESSLLLIFVDTGPGIPAEQSKRIFERYQSIPAASNLPQTGLGLPLVKTIMEGYGGTVTLDGAPGGGSAFTLEFPASVVAHATVGGSPCEARPPLLAPLYTAEFFAPADAAAPEAADDEADGARPLVLVVEDDPDMRTYVASVLQGQYRTACAASGREALAMLAERRFDLIVSDVMMPGMDGHAFLRAVRERAARDPIPFIFLTARDSMEERIDSLREGAVRYITKPFSPEMLTASIFVILRHDRELVETRVDRLRKGIDALLDEMESPGGMPPEEARPAAQESLLDELGLSGREREVVRLMLDGKSDKEIAVSLNLSPRTVANHNRRIYRKAGVNGRFELISKILTAKP